MNPAEKSAYGARLIKQFDTDDITPADAVAILCAILPTAQQLSLLSQLLAMLGNLLEKGHGR
jgi:hypothetical protein